MPCVQRICRYKSRIIKTTCRPGMFGLIKARKEKARKIGTNGVILTWWYLPGAVASGRSNGEQGICPRWRINHAFTIEERCEMQNLSRPVERQIIVRQFPVENWWSCLCKEQLSSFVACDKYGCSWTIVSDRAFQYPKFLSFENFSRRW